MNILVIDDEPLYRMVVTRFLEGEGWTVSSAGNGEEALKVLEGKKIDFIISDVYMPIMDGIKFQKAVHASPEHSHVPFLFVSGYDDEHTLEAVKASKSTGFMKKSKPMSELKEWIQYLSMPVEKRGTPPPWNQPRTNRDVPRGRGDDGYRR